MPRLTDSEDFAKQLDDALNDYADKTYAPRFERTDLLVTVVRSKNARPIFDIAEVVRCDRCKYWKYTSSAGMACTKKRGALGIYFPKRSYEYCSDGERKDEVCDEGKA